MTPEEEGGLLGNLPRSRPGTRSPKRDHPAKPAPRPRKPPPPPPERDGDPVGDALRAAARAGEAGVRVASAVARELVRRVPRP